MKIGPKRNDRRFSHPVREAAKIAGEELDTVHAKAKTLVGADMSHVEVWALMSGRFLTINANEKAFVARVTDDAPWGPMAIYDHTHYRDLCEEADIPYKFMDLLRAQEELERMLAK